MHNLIQLKVWRAMGMLWWIFGPSLQAQAVDHGSTHTRPRAAMAIGAAFSPKGELWIVGLDASSQLFVQISADAGRSRAPPRILDIGDDKVAADGENRPKIAFGPRGQVVIAYTQPLDKPYTGRIRMLRSSDAGRSFMAPLTVHQDRHLITHRFESIAFDAQGTLHTLWVDKRDLEASQASASSSVPASRYVGAAIYRNESKDGGQRFGPDIKVADHTCECCRIALAPTPVGGLVAMWRHVFAPNQRDHAFASLVPASTLKPVRATFDRWAIDACPHHGPGLAPAAAGGFHAVWFGEKAGIVRVRYGQLSADGSPRTEPIELPDERAEHADVLSVGPHVAIVWRSFDGKVTLWRAWISHNDGRSFVQKELGRSDDDNDHPRLARRGQQIYALWHTKKGVQVEQVIP